MLNPSSRSLERQRGVAMLTAILVVAVATVLATNLLWIATLDQRRTAAALATDQGLQYMLGAEAWVGDILRQDLVDSPDSDHTGEIWSLEIDPLPIEGGFIYGRLYDLQGRFNLNNLVTGNEDRDELMYAQFQRLLTQLELDQAMAGAVADWIDRDFEPRFPFGGEDDVYARSDPPYRVANGMITSTTELMAITGFTREAYELLEPHITALPVGTRLNVNTATSYVLASLSEEIDLNLANSMIEERGDGPFVNVQETFQGLVSEEMLPLIDGVSDHFLMAGQVTIGDTQLTINTVLQRHASGTTRTLFRTLGGNSG